MDSRESRTPQTRTPSNPSREGRRSPLLTAALVVAVAAIQLVATSASAQTTFTGRIFYNDLRDNGRFSLREDPFGAPGTGVGYSPGATNYLSGLDIVADFYEIDPFIPFEPSCIPQHYVGSATAGFDGVYEITFNGAEGCPFEPPGDLDIAIVFRLRVCNDTRCFSIEDDGQVLYTLEHPDAGLASPISVAPGVTTMDDFYFEQSPEDVYAMAANLYASLVDTTRVFHVVHGIPFERATYGEVFLRFPSSSTDNASTTSASQIHVAMPAQWTPGGGPMHEYGHVLHRRAWDGNSGACTDYVPDDQYLRDGVESWSAISREWPTAALKEGWANFVKRATLEDGTGGNCSSAGFDLNQDLAVFGSTGSPIANADPGEYPDLSNVNVTGPWDGKSYARNVTKLLCDWSDGVGDDDPYMAGDGDHFLATVWSTWYNLDRMWDWVASQDCLSICDYVDYYVDERKGVAAVGQSTHDDYVALIADLAYNNGLKCGLPNPTTLP